MLLPGDFSFQRTYARVPFFMEVKSSVEYTVPNLLRYEIDTLYVKAAKINDATDCLHLHIVGVEEDRPFYLIAAEEHLPNFIDDCLCIKGVKLVLPSLQPFVFTFNENYRVLLHGNKLRAS